MADSQSLFDALAGAAGAPVNRIGLNAGIANSQAINGLRSAQTEEALLNASKAQEEQHYRGQLEGALGDLLGDPIKAKAAATAMRAGYGSFKDAMTGLNEAQQNQFRTIAGDPSKLNTPEQTAAFQGINGKPNEIAAVPKEFAVQPGITPPEVHQTPLAAAETASYGANANLKNTEATNPSAFHPGGMGTFMNTPASPEEINNTVALLRENPDMVRSLLSGRSAQSPRGQQIISALRAQGLVGGAPGAPAGGPGAAPSTSTAPTPPPGVSFKEQADIKHGFSGGLEGRQMGSLNTMINHAQLMDQLADQLKNGDTRIGNTITNYWQKNFAGSPVPTNVQEAMSFLGREAVRATVNSGAGTGQERALAVDANSSPDAIHGAADTLRQLAGGQLQSLDLRGRRGGVDINQFLSPEAQRVYGTAGGHNAPGSTDTPGVNAPKTPAATSKGTVDPATLNQYAATHKISVDEAKKFLVSKGFTVPQ